MIQSPSETGMGTWQVRECPWPIEYSPPILDEIRRIAVDAFFSLPRGGAEVGGILLGTHSDDSVRILGFRPMECEHALGPGFALSDKDKGRLRAQLEDLRRDPAPGGMQVVGWYHTHTRSEIFLSDPDLQIYREFFPQSWQVALVLRPNGMKPTRAAFFFREADGTIRSEASYQEFIAGGHPVARMELPAPKKVNGRPAAPAPAAVPTPLAGPAPAPPGITPPAEAGRPVMEKIIPPPRQKIVEPAAAVAEASVKSESIVEAEAPIADPAPLPPATALLTYTETAPARRLAEVNPPIEMRPVEFVPPAFLIPPAPKKSSRWRWVSLAALLGLGTGAYFTSDYWVPLLEPKPVYLHLQTIDRAGQLNIRWDREALATQTLIGGTLEIVDGPKTTTIPLDAAKIRAGASQYARQSEMVEVHMTVRTSRGGTIEEFASFIGQKPAQADAAQQPRADSAEAEKARADLKKQELRVIELEQSLKRMQRQQRMEDERRRAQNQVPANRPPASEPQAPARPQPPAPTPVPQPAASSTAPTVPPPKPEITAERPPTGTPSTPAPVNRPAAATAPTPAQQSLSGSWVFSPASKSGSAFQPETATLAMTEAYGQVRGLFVGRYKVPRNQKFSPNVRFSFEGAVRGSSSRFPFVTSDGMKGEIELIRLPNKQDAIEVVWYSERDQLTFDDIFFRKP